MAGLAQFRKKAAAAVTAIRLEEGGKLKWRAGSWLVLEDGRPTTMTPKEFEAQYEAGPFTPVTDTPTPKRRGGRRPGPRNNPAHRGRTETPAKVIATTQAAPGRRSTFSAEQMAEARRLVVTDGKSIAEAAKELDIPYQAVWRWAKANGWDTK